MIDLMSIAKIEAAGGDLFGTLDGLYEPTDVRPEGYPDAVVWQGGNFAGDVNPVAHSMTDAYALLGTIAAIDVLGLPFYAVPMWSQYRHDTKLECLAWFGNIPATSIKWSTAGDAYVNDGDGSKVVVMGKSGNAPLRTQAGGLRGRGLGVERQRAAPNMQLPVMGHARSAQCPRRPSAARIRSPHATTLLNSCFRTLFTSMFG